MTTKIVFAVAIAAVAFPLAACGPTDKPPGPELPSYSGIDVPDPYTDNGVWQVPEQVQPGRYRVTENPDSQVVTLRWMELCSDPYCEHSTGGGVDDMAYGHENRFILIPNDGSVRAYRNNGVKLELVVESTERQGHKGR